METVCKAFKYKLHPTPSQAAELESVLRHCRPLYNAGLEERITASRRCGVSLSQYQQEAELKEVREAFPQYAAIHSQDVLARLDKTYQTFFARIKADKGGGFPRFQGRNRYHSFTFKEYRNGARLDNGFLVLSKIGRIAVRWSRPLEGTPKTVTISREADGWDVCCSCAKVPAQPLPATGEETGIDVGLKVFLITADGQTVENPRHYRRGEKRLKKCQRQVARRKQGSHRRRKAVQCLQCAHQHVQRQRLDFHHKTALWLLRLFEVISLEDLRVANMLKNHHLAKSVSDAGWAQFRSILEAKAAYAGRHVMAVPAQYTSQDYSGCGERVPKSLSVRTHGCRSCGLVLDRDENAARNVLWAGQALRGVVGVPAALNRESAGL